MKNREDSSYRETCLQSNATTYFVVLIINDFSVKTSRMREQYRVLSPKTIEIHLFFLLFENRIEKLKIQLVNTDVCCDLINTASPVEIKSHFGSQKLTSFTFK